MIDIPQLRYIVAVGENGSISKTAAAMFVSQPYISRIIKEVEDELGLVIFTRGKSGMVPTAEGEEFIFHAKSVLEQYNNLQSVFQSGGKASESVRITVMRSSHVFEAFMEFCHKLSDNRSEFEGKHMDIEFRETNLMNVIENVASKKADVGLVGYSSDERQLFHAMADRRNMTLREICFMRHFVVVSADHPLARRGGPVKVSELKDYPTIIYGDRSNYDFSVDGLLRSTGAPDESEYPVLIKVYDRGTQLGILSYTDSFIIGIRPFESQLTRFNIVSLPLDYEGDTVRESKFSIFALLTLNSKHQSKMANLFIDTAAEHFAKLSDV